MKKYFKWFSWLLIILFILLIVCVYFLKFGSLQFSFSEKQEDWGNFGGYIGGLLGTALTAITIYFLFKTYNTQNIQLKVQEKDSLIAYMDLQYNQIIKDIDDISFKQKKGSDALYAWDDTHSLKGNNVVNSLNLIIHTFDAHIQTIKTQQVIKQEIKNNFYTRAYLMVHSKIIWPVLDSIYNDSAFKGHTDNLYNNFNSLIKSTYEYLIPLNKLAKPDDSRILAVLNS